MHVQKYSTLYYQEFITVGFVWLFINVHYVVLKQFIEYFTGMTLFDLLTHYLIILDSFISA